MPSSATLRNLRTFILCLLTTLGLLGLGCYALRSASESMLVLAVGITVVLPLSLWIGGKAVASGMAAITSVFGNGGKQ